MTKKSFPDFVPPMMAESAKAPFDAPDWIFEIKLDGYRAITVFDAAGKPQLWSRNGLPLEQKFQAAQLTQGTKTRSAEDVAPSGSTMLLIPERKESAAYACSQASACGSVRSFERGLGI